MLKKHTPVLVGLLVLVGTAAFLFSFGSLDQGMNVEGAYRVHAVFDDVTGLVKNSTVEMNGVPVGRIDDVKLHEDDPTRARVTLLIEERIELHEGVEDPETGEWTNGATARRVQSSLLGDYYVAITPGLAGSRIEPGGEIRITQSYTGLDAVMQQLDESSEKIFPKLDDITSDISAITESLRATMAGPEGQRKLAEIRDNIHATSDNLAELSESTQGFMQDSVFSRREQVGRIVDNVEQATANLRAISAEGEGRVDRILDDVESVTGDLRSFVGQQVGEEGGDEGTVKRTLSRIDEAAKELQGTLSNARKVSERVEQGEGTIGRLVNDDELIDGVERVVSDIESFTRTYRRLQVELDFRSEYNIRQGAVKNYVSFSLYPKPDKFYFFQVVSDPQGKRSTTKTVTTSNDPEDPPVLVEETVRTTNSLKFTAQFAKRWRPLTLRYGIMESSGGIGIDLTFLEDALKFKLDAFDFARDELPRLRLLARWEFVRHVYVAAGMDDILNNDRRDYFVGLGVNFNDRHLKSLLPFAPSP